MNIGGGELFLIAIAVLVLFGPRRLPEIARTVGKAIREFKRATGELTEELKEGFEDLERGGGEQPRPGPRD